MSLDHFGGPWRDARVVAVFGDHEAPPLPSFWEPHFERIELVYADPAEFRRKWFFAANDLRFELVGSEAVLSCLCDADTAFLRPIPEGLLLDAQQNPAILGVIAHYPFPIHGLDRISELTALLPPPGGEGLYPGMPQELAWERLGEAIIGRPPKRPLKYTLCEGDTDINCPFYINYGFLAGPPKLLRALYRELGELHQPTATMLKNGFYGQVAIALAVEKANLPYKALPMRFNFPNDRDADRIHSAELDRVILMHYLRHDLFDRQRIFAEERQFTRFLSMDLVGSDAVFQDHVRRVTGGTFPFLGEGDSRLGQLLLRVAKVARRLRRAARALRRRGRASRTASVTVQTKPQWTQLYETHPLSFGPAEYLKQAGHTIHGKPISIQQFDLMLSNIQTLLNLQPNDTLLDLCCGNGIFTKELAKKCRRVVGIDFSEPLLHIANRDHRPENVSYHLLNALEVDSESAVGSFSFDKVIMCAALQHFETSHLEHLLRNLRDLTSRGRIILFLFVPDRRRKWRFYDTLTKRAKHLLRVFKGQEQMGTWWHPEDFYPICAELGLTSSFHQMDARLHPSRYRFDIRITSTEQP